MTVANDRGTKREDPDTGKKFYDLNKDPVVSPYTGKSYPRSYFEQTAVKGSRASRQGRGRRRGRGRSRSSRPWRRRTRDHLARRGRGRRGRRGRGSDPRCRGRRGSRGHRRGRGRRVPRGRGRRREPRSSTSEAATSASLAAVKLPLASRVRASLGCARFGRASPAGTSQGIRGHSSVGRALAWHARGRRFDPVWLHHLVPSLLGISDKRPVSDDWPFCFFGHFVALPTQLLRALTKPSRVMEARQRLSASGQGYSGLRRY